MTASRSWTRPGCSPPVDGPPADHTTCCGAHLDTVRRAKGPRAGRGGGVWAAFKTRVCRLDLEAIVRAPLVVAGSGALVTADEVASTAVAFVVHTLVGVYGFKEDAIWRVAVDPFKREETVVDDLWVVRFRPA